MAEVAEEEGEGGFPWGIGAGWHADTNKQAAATAIRRFIYPSTKVGG